MADFSEVDNASSLSPETWEQLPLDARQYIAHQENLIQVLRAQVTDLQAQLGLGPVDMLNGNPHDEMLQFNQLEGISILIVEDDASMCRLMEIAFKRVGVDVFVVDEVSLALKVLTEFVPDIIVCDYKMGYVSGLDVLRVVRNSTLLTEVAFILITAIVDPSVRREAKALGADEVLSKPFLIGDLIKLVTAHLPKVQNEPQAVSGH
jgi:CheY-like chemotaxis protein